MIIRQLAAIRSEVRARMTEIDDDIASIRTQIAATDLQRQASRKPIDPSWFHRAKTALRHLQRERGGTAPAHGHAAQAEGYLEGPRHRRATRAP